jgi:SAM-dependent methyltransferase
MGGVPGYGDDLAAIHAAGFTAIAAQAAAELLGRLPSRARVVELGCGDGTTAALLSEAGHDVLGIDVSPSMIALARARAPRASLRVGSFIDAPLPEACDAVLAIGEVLGYALDERADGTALDTVFERCAHALTPGGLLMFDLARPDRVDAGGARGWAEGDGWAVLVEAERDGPRLRRRIVSYRETGDGRFRRGEELHRLRLHEPADVLERLDRAGFDAGVLEAGYGGVSLPAGITAYLGRRRGAGAGGDSS